MGCASMERVSLQLELRHGKSSSATWVKGLRVVSLLESSGRENSRFNDVHRLYDRVFITFSIITQLLSLQLLSFSSDPTSPIVSESFLI